MDVDAGHSQLRESELVVCSIKQRTIQDAEIVDLSIRKRYARPRFRLGRSRTPVLEIGESETPPPSPVAVSGRASPRERSGRSRTPIRQRARVQSAERSVDSRYKSLGARPKTYKQSVSIDVLDYDKDDITEVQVIEGSSKAQAIGHSDYIDLTGNRLPSHFPTFAFEPNLELTKLCVPKLSERSTPTPTSTHSAVQCEEASTSRSPVIPVKELQGLELVELDVHKVLGDYPPPDNVSYDGDCDSHEPGSVNGQSEFNSSPETHFPTHFKRKVASGNNKCGGSKGDKVSHTGDKVGVFPESTTDSYIVTKNESLNRVIESLKEDSGLNSVFPRFSKPPPQKPRRSLLGPPPPPACRSAELGPNSRALRRGAALNRCAERIGKPKNNVNKWNRKQKKKKGNRNVVKSSSSWWTGRYLQPSHYHIPGNPRWHLTLRAPPVNLPVHHMVDSAMINYAEDEHYCGCEYGDQGEGNPGTCWCRSSVREITLKYVVESSVHFNMNEMDIMPDGY